MATVPPADPPAQRPTATLFQPWNAHQPMPAAGWLAELGRWADLGVRRVVVQWLRYQDAEVLTGDAGLPALQRLLDAAAAHGLTVWLGLAFDDARFFAQVDLDQPVDRVRAYLFDERLAAAQAVIQGLQPLRSHAAIAGWYLSEEIDDRNWPAPARRALLIGWLTALTGAVRRGLPPQPIALSGFVNTGRTTPAQAAALWDAVLAGVPAITHLLLQDGIGAGHATLADGPAVLQAVAAVARRHGRHCQPIVELMAAGVGASAINPVPASVERVRQQLVQAAQTGDEVIAFSVPDHLLWTYPPLDAPGTVDAHAGERVRLLDWWRAQA